MVEAKQKIKSLAGFEEKHAELSAAGFTKHPQNIKALWKADGDVEKAKKILLEKREKKQKADLEHYLPAIKAAGYEEQFKQLVAAGFDKAKKNLRVLTKTGGDAEKAKELLVKKKANPPMDQLKDAGWTEKHTQLVEAGYFKPKKNYKALQETKGDVEQAKKWLDEQKSKKEEKKKKKDKTPMDFDVKSVELAAAGYTNQKKISKALRKADGDVEKAKAILAEKYVKKEKANKEKYLPAIKEAGYEEQHGQLVAAGYNKPKKNLKVLKKTGGDVEKAKQLLAEKKDKSVEFEADLKTSEYQEEISQLTAAGFKKVKKNLKLLKENAGNVEKVKQILSEKQEKKKHKEKKEEKTEGKHEETKVD